MMKKDAWFYEIKSIFQDEDGGKIVNPVDDSCDFLFYAVADRDAELNEFVYVSKSLNDAYLTMIEYNLDRLNALINNTHYFTIKESYYLLYKKGLENDVFAKQFTNPYEAYYFANSNGMIAGS